MSLQRSSLQPGVANGAAVKHRAAARVAWSIWAVSWVAIVLAVALSIEVEPGSVGGTAWPRLDASLRPRAQLLSLRAGRRSTPITDARLSAQHQCDFWDSLFAPE